MPRSNGKDKRIVAAIAGPPDDEGMTAQELATESGQALKTTQDRLKVLETQGRLIIGFRRNRDSRGRNIRVPVYRLKEETSNG